MGERLLPKGSIPGSDGKEIRFAAEITRVAENYVSLTDENDIKFMNLLLDALEDNDDVQNVAHNWDE